MAGYFPCKGEGRHVHYFEVFLDTLGVGDGFVFRGGWVLLRIGGIDTIHPGSFQDHIGLDLDGTKRARCIGREVRITGSGAKDHHAAFSR